MERREPSRRAPTGATLAIVTALAAGGFCVVMPLVMHTVPGTTLEAPFPTQHQHGETLSYLLAYLVILPLAIAGGRRLADGVASGPGRDVLPALAALLLASSA